MSIFDSIEKLITEHGSAAILNKQLAFAKDQFSDLERKVSDLQTQTGRLDAQLERERLDHQKTRDELQKLKERHAEEIRFFHDVEFRKGSRTGGRWLPFCPKCHLPITLSRNGGEYPFCTDSKCGWESTMMSQDFKGYEQM